MWSQLLLDVTPCRTPPHLPSPHQVRDYALTGTNRVYGAGYGLESATLGEQLAIERVIGYRYNWVSAAALLDPKQAGGAATIRAATTHAKRHHAATARAEPLGRWIAVHVDRFAYRALDVELVQRGYRALHAMCTDTPHKVIRELERGDADGGGGSGDADGGVTPRNWSMRLSELIQRQTPGWTPKMQARGERAVRKPDDALSQWFWLGDTSPPSKELAPASFSRKKPNSTSSAN